HVDERLGPELDAAAGLVRYLLGADQGRELRLLLAVADRAQVRDVLRDRAHRIRIGDEARYAGGEASCQAHGGDLVSWPTSSAGGARVRRQDGRRARTRGR